MACYILPIGTVFLCAICFIFMCRDMKDNRTLFQSEEEIRENAKLINVPVIIYTVIMVLITMGVAVLFCTVYKDNSILMSMKRLVLLSLLWPIALIDFKTYRIPNVFIMFGVISRIVILAFELIAQSEFVWMTLLSEVIAAVSLLLAAALCALCIKNSIGFGDMKLFIVMGLMLSLNGIWSAIFLSLIVSFFISLFLLITKKKTRKDAIPFGPAIVIGTYLSVCLSGM